MKISNENNFRFVKPVFSSTTTNFTQLSKYTFGEDNYSLHKEDKEIKFNHITNVIIAID